MSSSFKVGDRVVEQVDGNHGEVVAVEKEPRWDGAGEETVVHIRLDGHEIEIPRNAEAVLPED